MIRRPLWLAAGVAMGVGGTLWAEQRVRRQVRRLGDAVAPTAVASAVRGAATGTGERVRSAVAVGRQERRRREDELWQDLSPGAAVPRGRDRGTGRPR